MSMAVKFDAARGLMTVRIGSKTEISDVKAAYPRILRLRAFKKGYHSLWDFRAQKIRRIPIEDIRDLIFSLQKMSAIRGEGYRTALVTGGQLDYHLLNAYTLFIRRLGNISIRVINNDMHLAMNWLRQERGGDSQY